MYARQVRIQADRFLQFLPCLHAPAELRQNRAVLLAHGRVTGRSGYGLLQEGQCLPVSPVPEQQGGLLEQGLRIRG